MPSIGPGLLDKLRRALNLSEGLDQTTELASGVNMTLEIGNYVAGSGVGLPDDSIFQLTMTNAHAGAGSDSSEGDPYNYTTATNMALRLFARNDLDLWLLTAGITTTVIANSVGARLAYNANTATRMISPDGSSTQGRTILQSWGSFFDAGADNVGIPNESFRPLRLSREFPLNFGSQAVTGAVTMIMKGFVQAVPVGSKPSVWL